MSRRWSSPFHNLRAFLQSFGPGVTGELVSDLVRQLSLATKGITLVIDVLNGVGIPEDTTHLLAQLKDEADHLHSEFIDSLTRALVTPLDREDLYRYSREIHDLMDELRDFAREWRLLHTGSDEVLLRVVCQLANALDAARRGTEKLAHPTSASAQDLQPLIDALRSANLVRQVQEEEVTALFHGEVTMDLLRTRELLHRLDAVGRHLVAGLNIIVDGLVKREEYEPRWREPQPGASPDEGA